MFSSAYFSSEYFNEYFKITGEIIPIDEGGSGSGSKGVQVNWRELQLLGLHKDDQEVMEFIVAFVLSR